MIRRDKTWARVMAHADMDIFYAFYAAIKVEKAKTKSAV